MSILQNLSPQLVTVLKNKMSTGSVLLNENKLTKQFSEKHQFLLQISNVWEGKRKCIFICSANYTGCPQKAERWIFSTLLAKNVIFFTSLDEASSAEENDTKIIKFGWVTLNLCPLLEIQSFSNFAWFLRPMSKALCLGKAFHKVFWGSPLIRGNKRNTDQWSATKHHMELEGFSRHNSSLIGRKNQANVFNDFISRNRHRIRITQPNLIILVSFSSAVDALSNDVKKTKNF